ncbi:hypothetical protein OH460_08165 [Vibrio sp. Makdt]|uniref:hypothetical protein n=1 Tax=Vibrio sp. Makdt TaxID=2998828 RepID=UPI0022CD53C4|nr:hypothetical protein [Vibrio sp. Makdt]MDA0152273.1 hypothetical protein [Vibrio sp. Makdt]
MFGKKDRRCTLNLWSVWWKLGSSPRAGMVLVTVSRVADYGHEVEFDSQPLQPKIQSRKQALQIAGQTEDGEPYVAPTKALTQWRLTFIEAIQSK